jgi:hypothetical protein
MFCTPCWESYREFRSTTPGQAPLTACMCCSQSLGYVKCGCVAKGVPIPTNTEQAEDGDIPAHLDRAIPSTIPEGGKGPEACRTCIPLLSEGYLLTMMDIVDSCDPGLINCFEVICSDPYERMLYRESIETNEFYIALIQPGQPALGDWGCTTCPTDGPRAAKPTLTVKAHGMRCWVKLKITAQGSYCRIPGHHSDWLVVRHVDYGVGP